MNGPCGFCATFTALGLPGFFTQDALFALQERVLSRWGPWGQTAKWQLRTTTLSNPPGPLSSGNQTCHRDPPDDRGGQHRCVRHSRCFLEPGLPAELSAGSAERPRAQPSASHQPFHPVGWFSEDRDPLHCWRRPWPGTGAGAGCSFALSAYQRLWITDFEKSEGFGWAPGPRRVD